MRILSFIFIIALAISASAQNGQIENLFENGTRFAESGNFAKALEDFRAASKLSENAGTSNDFRAKIHFNIGVCLFRLDNSAEAVEEFERAIKTSEGVYQKAFYALGMAQTRLKNWRKAAEALQEAVRLEKTDGEAWFDLGLVLVEEKDFEAAQAAFENSIRYKTVAAADAHNNVGVILALKGDFDSAEKRFKLALRKSSGKSVEAQNNLKFCELYKQNAALKPQFSGKAE
jgi:tetratricopeptide (TPR) repeat protein